MIDMTTIAVISTMQQTTIMVTVQQLQGCLITDNISVASLRYFDNDADDYHHRHELMCAF